VLSERILTFHSIQLWKLSEDNKEYERFKTMLSGHLKNSINLTQLNVSLLADKADSLRGKPYVVVIHDGSDIRKPESKKLESLGWVKDLDGKWIRGYGSFNSVLVDVKTARLELLRCTPYSNGDPLFVSKQEAKDYEQGQLKDATRRKEIEALLDSKQHYNLESITRDHIASVHQAIKAASPDCLIIHVLDRGFDDEALFDYITDLGDYFVIRMRKHRKDEQGEKLIVKDLEAEMVKDYDKVVFNEKTYCQAQGRFEWGAWKGYGITRVRFTTKSGAAIFKEPLLLGSNLEIKGRLMALLIFELYMHRAKIESVFRFLKQVLGWEDFLVRDWETIKNLIAFGFYIGGFFFEIEHELTKDPTVQWLAQLGGAKGKVTRGFVMKGLTKLLVVESVNRFRKQNNISDEQVQAVLKRFTLLKNFS